ncbi:MAG TPA: thermopsin family protease [Thermoplasmata archaeon]|nr:thermopsin family protease [Thermoplasmata archaeon]
MSSRRSILLGAALVTLIMLVSSMGLLSGLLGARPGPSDGSLPSAVHSTAASLTGGSGPSLLAGSGKDVAPSPLSSRSPENGPASASVGGPATSTTLPYGISQVEHSIAAGQVNRSAALFPRSPTPGAPIHPDGPITGPSYATTPAPMGLADIGEGASGPYEYNTSSFAATMTIDSFQDYNPGYSAWEVAPDWMTFQLNTVTDNTSYPGADNGSFWIQNVVHFNGTELQFEDNIWNFSSPAGCLETGTLLSYEGQQDGCFYYVYGPTYTVSYPFTITLYNNVTSYFDGVEDIPLVTFGYLLTNATASVGGYFDEVTWNGAVVNTPQFQVNGYNYNPLGYLTYDAEIILGGNGGGSNAVIQEMDATTQLQYVNGSGDYVNIPSAYDYGADTGETSIGVSATYAGATETLRQGPSSLYGLWNTTNSLFGPAVPAVTQTVTGVSGLPNYSFAFAENLTAYDAGAQNWSYWPAASTGTISGLLPWLPGGNGWCVEVFANGFDSGVDCLSGNGSSTFALTADTSVIDTPVYLNTIGQAFAFGSSGLSGVKVLAGNLWINDTVSTLASPFLRLNDWDYPSFVLFAAHNLSFGVTVNDFTQGPTSFNYTDVYSQTLDLPWYSQGYYFNFGLGGFTVTNVTTSGNQSLAYATGFGSYPIQAVEFYGTFYSVASNIVNSQDDFGVDVMYSYAPTLDNISSQSGANAFVALDTGNVTAVDISTNGTDIGGVPSYGAIYEGTFLGILDGLTATNGSLGGYFDQAVASEVDHVSASTFSEALYLYEFYDSDVNSVNVTSGAYGISADVLSGDEFTDVTLSGGATGGIVDDAYETSFANFDTNQSTGVEVYNSLLPTISGVEAWGPSAVGLVVFDDELGAVSNVSAYAGAVYGLLAEEILDFTVTGVSANNSTVGALVEDAESVTVSNVSATNGSVGVGVLDTLFGLVENTSIGSGSAGVVLEEDAWVNVTNFNATETALSSNYFYTAFGFGPFATSAVSDLLDENITILDGTSVDYNYAVVSNDSNYVRVQQVSEWNGVWGIALNGTQNATLIADFLYGDQVGIWASDTANLLVLLCTVEGSAGYGIWLDGGTNALVVENNFVANNGASVDGVYSAASVQAGLADGVSALFTMPGLGGSQVGNYWSDWNAESGPYVINATVSDTAPLAAFAEFSWLLFEGTGLPSGGAWGLTLDGVTYSATASLVIIPSWVLGDPLLSYLVTPPTGYVVTPNSGTVDYTGADQIIQLAFSPTPETVTFSETGLATGASWNATLNGVTLTSTGSTIVFSIGAGTYGWSVDAAGYTTETPSGSVTVTSSGATVDVTFTAIPVYAVTFTESGLPTGTSWSVILGGVPETSTGSSIVFEETAGTYSYSVGSVSGYGVSSPASGSVTVSNAAVNVGVTYVALPATTYSVTFTESGLATGTVWSVTLNGVTEYSGTTTVVFSEAPGSFTYTVGAVTGYTAPVGGSVMVTDASVGVSLTYTALPAPATYTLTFTQSGLTSGTTWSVTVNGVTYTSTAGSIAVSGLNGTYTYTVSAVSGYSVSPVSGTEDVTSGDQTVAVTFTPVTTPTTYTITFTETGLPSGTSWSVTVNGEVYTESTATIQVSGGAGGYTYSVGAVSGYTATPGAGTVTLTTGDQSVPIAFASPSSTSSSGLSTTDWTIIGLVIGLVIGALVVALIMRGRGGRGPPAEYEQPEQEPAQSWEEGQESPQEGSAETPPDDQGST